MRNLVLLMLVLGICSCEKLNKITSNMVNLEEGNPVKAGIDGKGVSISAKFDRHAAMLIFFGTCQIAYMIWMYYST